MSQPDSVSKRWTWSSTGCANVTWHDSLLLYWPSVVLVAAHAPVAAKLEVHTQLVVRSNTHGPVAAPSRGWCSGGEGGHSGGGGEGGGGKGEGGGGEGEGGGGEGGGNGTPHTSSQSKPHPMPAVQPSRSSTKVQSLAPAAWQMASASVKVLLRAHPQPALDSPHTEQPGRRDPQAGDGLTSAQQRTWPQKWWRRVGPCTQ